LKFGINLQQLPDFFSLGCVLGLALFPSLSSFLFMAIAIKYIGPSKTAILGVLEPVTALIIGVLVFGELLNWQQMIAVVIILASVLLVITGKPPTAIKSKLKS
jgi:drug/metabolite transporter (DMT)-like permease